MTNFLLRMTDTMTSQNIGLSSWDTLYSAKNNYEAYFTYRKFALGMLLKTQEITKHQTFEVFFTLYSRIGYKTFTRLIQGIV
jgi:hypothetical protein